MSSVPEVNPSEAEGQIWQRRVTPVVRRAVAALVISVAVIVGPTGVARSAPNAPGGPAAPALPKNAVVVSEFAPWFFPADATCGARG